MSCRHHIDRTERISFTPLSIQDGDTCTLLASGFQQCHQRYRLADIDAPERGEPFYIQSRETLAQYLRMGNLRIMIPATQPKPLTANNRTAAYIYTDHLLINAAMCGLGMAVPYLRWGHNGPTSDIITMSRQAHRNRIGIWSCGYHRLHELWTP